MSGFGRHALAAFGAATIVSCASALVWGLAVAGATRGAFGVADTAFFAFAAWLMTALIAIPAASIVFTALWPVTRRRSPAAPIICLLAGVATGALLAPFGAHGVVSAARMLIFAATGLAVAACYVRLVAPPPLSAAPPPPA